MPPIRILLVDDDRLVLATLAKGLREAGYAVETADSGESALTIAASAAFDLAMLDIRMPGVSGTETAVRLRDEHGIPALFLSAYSDQELVRQAVADGGLVYLVKPVDSTQLVPAIEAAFARAGDLKALEETKAQLERALAGGRYTSIAKGILMERRGLTEQAAFETLRASARSRQCKLEELAQGLVEALERVNGL